MKREVLAAASPLGWPPPQHGAAAPLRGAAAPQNTTDPHSETLWDILSAPPLWGRGAGGWYRLKRKSVPGNSIRRSLGRYDELEGLAPFGV
jgi:hypothetical protein